MLLIPCVLLFLLWPDPPELSNSELESRLSILVKTKSLFLFGDDWAEEAFGYFLLPASLVSTMIASSTLARIASVGLI